LLPLRRPLSRPKRLRTTDKLEGPTQVTDQKNYRIQDLSPPSLTNTHDSTTILAALDRGTGCGTNAARDSSRSRGRKRLFTQGDHLPRQPQAHRPPPEVPPLPGEHVYRRGLRVISTSIITGVPSHRCDGSLAHFKGDAIAIQFIQDGGSLTAVGHEVLASASSALCADFRLFSNAIHSYAPSKCATHVVTPRGGRIESSKVILVSVPVDPYTPHGLRRTLERTLREVLREANAHNVTSIAIATIDACEAQPDANSTFVTALRAAAG
jgi:hypothetical protein